jgi:hypothetical protein
MKAEVWAAWAAAVVAGFAAGVGFWQALTAHRQARTALNETTAAEERANILRRQLAETEAARLQAARVAEEQVAVLRQQLANAQTARSEAARGAELRAALHVVGVSRQVFTSWNALLSDMEAQDRRSFDKEYDRFVAVSATWGAAADTAQATVRDPDVIDALVRVRELMAQASRTMRSKMPDGRLFFQRTRTAYATQIRQDLAKAENGHNDLYVAIIKAYPGAAADIALLSDHPEEV